MKDDRPQTYYVGTCSEEGVIHAVAGPFRRARDASEARVPLVGRDAKYTIPLIVHRPPREVRMLPLPEFLAWWAVEKRRRG